MILFIILFSALSWAEQPFHWLRISGITEKHEFYKNDQIVDHPKDSWQHLFTFSYLDRELVGMKDCVFFRVPGDDLGSLKIKTLSFDETCEDYILKSGEREVSEIKSLHYSVSGKQVLFDFTFGDLRHEKWMIRIQENFIRPTPGMSLSSAEFKGPKMLLLTSLQSSKKSKIVFLKENEICHDINEECKETTPSKCNQCADSWYEVPNGCAISPKFCGIHKCGQKDSPACRRGMKWQRKETSLDCVTDSSFAYCSKGLSVQCEGKKAFCR